MAESWQCPYCNHYTVISSENSNSSNFIFNQGNRDGYLALKNQVKVCSNPNCKEYVLTSTLREAYVTNNTAYYLDSQELINHWQLKPNSNAKPLPEYIPKAIKEDYHEACSIVNLSPKSSATLARRCLQGMIRDFWNVKPARLVDEIEAIKDKIDPLVWDSIDVVRKIGNIGAHMEKDINQIVDVEPHEAELLINLIETLIAEWYVNRHEREKRLLAIKGLGQLKEDVKSSYKQTDSSS